METKYLVNEVYLLCLSYVDNFDVLGVYTDYIKASDELRNLERYVIHDEPEMKYKIYSLELNKYYSYKDFDKTEIK